MPRLRSRRSRTAAVLSTLTLTVALGGVAPAALAATGAPAVPPGPPAGGAASPADAAPLPNGRYIVVLKDPPSAVVGSEPEAGSPFGPGRKAFDPDHPRVKAHEKKLLKEQQRVAKKAGVQPAVTFQTAVNGFAAELTAEQAAQLSQDPAVLTVAPDRAFAPPPPPDAPTPGPVGSAGSSAVYSPADVLGLTGKKGGWKTAFGGQDRAGRGVVVGVLDTGVHPDNPALAGDPVQPLKGKPKVGEPYREADGRIAVLKADGTTAHADCQTGPGFPADSCTDKLLGAYAYPAWLTDLPEDFRHPAEVISPLDVFSHGTHVATTAAGNADVPRTVGDTDWGRGSGIAPEATVISYKVCWEESQGSACYESATVEAVEQSIENNVDVLNYSVSGSSWSLDDPVSLAFRSAAAAGIFVAEAAGNTGPEHGTVNHVSPWAAVVAAATYRDPFSPPQPEPAITWFSSRGPAGAEGGELLSPDLAAPGSSVLAGASPLDPWRLGSQFTFMGGTSMATPHVAGAAALLAGEHPDWSPAAIKSALMTTAGPLFTEDGAEDADNFATGAGFVDPAAAARPGLVYDAGPEQWDALLRGDLCARDVNQASLALPDVLGSVSVKRTVTATENGRLRFSADVPGVEVTASPATLDLKKGQSREVTLTVTPTSAAPGEWVHGEMTWARDGGRPVPDVTSPVSVQVMPHLRAEKITHGGGTTGSVDVGLRPGFTGELDPEVFGLVQAEVRTVTANGTDGEFNTYTDTVHVPDGAGRLTLEIPTAGEATDYWFMEVRSPSGERIFPDPSWSWTQRITISDPEPGEYTVVALSWPGAADGALEVTLYDRDRGNLAVSPDPVPVTAGEPTSATLSWSGLAPGEWRGLVRWADGVETEVVVWAYDESWGE